MLAQIAGQYPDASAALLDQARANQISDSAWRKIATGLAGDQYQLGTPPGDVTANGAALPGLKTYHIQNGNQNFYSLPVAGDAEISADKPIVERDLEPGSASGVAGSEGYADGEEVDGRIFGTSLAQGKSDASGARRSRRLNSRTCCGSK
jgi:hypothetical protein